MRLITPPKLRHSLHENRSGQCGDTHRALLAAETRLLHDRIARVRKHRMQMKVQALELRIGAIDGPYPWSAACRPRHRRTALPGRVQPCSLPVPAAVRE